MFGYRVGDPAADLSRDDRDSAAFAPLAAVIDPAFDWQGDRPPRDAVARDGDLRGARQGLHRRCTRTCRRRCAARMPGSAAPAVIAHLQRLGVTAIELMPVHHHVGRPASARARPDATTGATTRSCFFAPDLRYASRSGRPAGREFKTMVRALHAAGIEVILDVVYNHTAEGNQLGPTLSLRGIDNAAYYRLAPERAALLRRLHRLRQHAEHAPSARAAAAHGQPALLGRWRCTSTVSASISPRALARELYDVDRLGGVLRRDPSGSGRLAAEADRRAVGSRRRAAIRSATSRCSGRNGTAATATAVRRFWRGDGGTVSELATRLAGSADLYEQTGRRPYASINFVTCHDGFTLDDLVSYDRKHNEANGEDNRDGERRQPELELRRRGSDRRSGDSCAARAAEAQFPGDAVPVAGRADDQSAATKWAGRSAATTTPTARTTRSAGRTGISSEDQRAFFDFTCRVVHLMHEHPVLRRRSFFQGRRIRGSDVRDIMWLRRTAAR